MTKYKKEKEKEKEKEKRKNKTLCKRHRECRRKKIKQNFVQKSLLSEARNEQVRGILEIQTLILAEIPKP